MTKFKAGDFVECVEEYVRITVGMTGTVRAVNGGTPSVLVEWDNFEGMGHGGGHGLPNNGYYVYPKNLRHSTFTLENE